MARGQGVVAFTHQIYRLKDRKKVVCALSRLRNTTVFFFSEFSLRIFGHFCTTKCAMYPFVLALSHPQLSLYEPTLSFTFAKNYHTFKTYIKPAFNKCSVEELKCVDLQTLVNSYSEMGKNRTAKKIYQLLCTLFDYAVADGIISISPMSKVKLAHYEQEHGVPLTREEEQAFISSFMENPDIYKQAFAFILYTGIRRSGLPSAVVEDGWVRIITAKQRKGYREKSRSIPIPPMLERILPQINVDEIKKLSNHILTKRLPYCCENHHLHDLRHTFVTRAQECDIKREYVSLWGGHKADSSLTSSVYTHLHQNKELQIEEMKKFQYTL